MSIQKSPFKLFILISFLFLLPCAVSAVEILQCNKLFIFKPTIDAKFDDLAWKNAKAAVFPHDKGNTVEVRAVYDDKNLYLAVSSRETDINKTLAAAAANSKNAVNYAYDELLDLAFIAHVNNGWEIHRLILNPAGAMSCVINNTPGPVPVPNTFNQWEVKLKSAMSLDKKDGLWKAEFEIPLNNLGLDNKDGAKSYFTVGRYFQSNLTSYKWALAAFGKYTEPSLAERTAKWKEYTAQDMCVKFRIPDDATAGFNDNNNSTEVAIKNPYINSSAYIFPSANGKCGPNGENFSCYKGDKMKNLAGDDLTVSCVMDYGMCNVERTVQYMLTKQDRCLVFNVHLRTASAGCLYPDGIQPVSQDFDVVTGELEDVILTAVPIEGCAPKAQPVQQ